MSFIKLEVKVELSPDYKDLLKIFNKYKVRYIVVGAYAVIYYTVPRYTKDLDIWVEPTPENADKIYNALKEFGAPLIDVQREDFTNKSLIYQIGVAPVRIDLITSILGVEFAFAWKNRKRTNYDRVPINILDIKNLIKSKKILRRDQDILDLKRLTKLPKK